MDATLAHANRVQLVEDFWKSNSVAGSFAQPHFRNADNAVIRWTATN
jgi:hypothetical protein